MSDVIPTIKVKPWGKDQGEFVEINADDFDPAAHKLFGEIPAQEGAATVVKSPRKKGK